MTNSRLKNPGPPGQGFDSQLAKRRRGLSVPDLIIAVLVLGLVVSVSMPAIQAIRERSRVQKCGQNLRAVTLALREYHDAFQALPPAAIWRGDGLRTVMLKDVKQIDLITYENWAQLILPQLDRSDVVAQFDRGKPVMAPENMSGRMTSIATFNCPTDHFNRLNNAYSFRPFADQDSIADLARGNYAINGGTQNLRYHPENASQPRFDGLEIIADQETRRFEFVGTGIAGINRSFTFDDFRNGQSTFVAVEEVRSGIHPLDPRGVWSLGQIGGSMTFAHGISSDDGSPNNQWDRADDILGCQLLHDTLGSETLLNERMPCVHYNDQNNQATSRSLHGHGVNVAFLDGTVRFVNDEVDKGLWHVMHSRETPAEIFGDGISDRLGPYRVPADAVASKPAKPREGWNSTMENSLGMKLVRIPAGEFLMGIPDSGNGAEPPPECPVHRVVLSRAFWLGQYEVTQQQFQQIMRKNPSHHTAAIMGVENTDDFPVESVSWDEANEFCKTLSELAEERTAGRRYRLPTEAEWEYACRAGKSRPYQWSQSRRSQDDSGENAGILPSLPLMPVGSFRANPMGLFDMRGNVWEWTADWFERTYYARSPIVDPQGPAEGFIKVVRGSDWTFIGEACRINYPMTPPWKTSPYLGFRIVCEPSTAVD